MDLQWHFPMDVHFGEIWCVVFCPESPGGPRSPRGTSRSCSSPWPAGGSGGCAAEVRRGPVVLGSNFPGNPLWS